MATENRGYVTSVLLFLNSIKNENLNPAWFGTCLTMLSSGSSSFYMGGMFWPIHKCLNDSKESGCPQALPADLQPGLSEQRAPCAPALSLPSPLYPPHQQQGL